MMGGTMKLDQRRGGVGTYGPETIVTVIVVE
jgi:hypothetical protein